GQPSGGSGVARIRTAVVFPAPFGPSTPSTVPGRATRSTPASAVVLPNRLTKPLASIAFVMIPLLSCHGHGWPWRCQNQHQALPVRRTDRCQNAVGAGVPTAPTSPRRRPLPPLAPASPPPQAGPSAGGPGGGGGARGARFGGGGGAGEGGAGGPQGAARRCPHPPAGV